MTEHLKGKWYHVGKFNIAAVENKNDLVISLLSNLADDSVLIV